MRVRSPLPVLWRVRRMVRRMGHRLGQEMCGEIHREGHKQDNHKQCQQCHVDTDRDFTPHDFPENPQAQPDQAYQECKAANDEPALHYHFLDLSGDILPQSVDILQTRGVGVAK